MKRILYILMGTLLYSASSLALDLASFRTLVMDFSNKQVTRKQLIDAYEQLETDEDRGVADLMIDEARLNSIIQLKEQEGYQVTFTTLIGLYQKNELPREYLLQAYDLLATPEDKKVADQLLRTNLSTTIAELRQSSAPQPQAVKKEAREAQTEQQPSAATQSRVQRDELPKKVSHYPQRAAVPQTGRSSTTTISRPSIEPTRRVPAQPVRGGRTQRHLEAAYEKKQRQKALLANLEQQARVQEAAFAEAARSAQEQKDLEKALKESARIVPQRVLSPQQAQDLANLEQQARVQEAAFAEAVRSAQEQKDLEKALKESARIAPQRVLSPQQAQEILTQSGMASRATVSSTAQATPPYQRAEPSQEEPLYLNPSVQPRPRTAVSSTTGQDLEYMQEAAARTAAREAQRRAQIEELLADRPAPQASQGRVTRPPTPIVGTTSPAPQAGLEEEVAAPLSDERKAELWAKIRGGLVRKEALEAQERQLAREALSEAGAQRATQSTQPQPAVPTTITPAASTDLSVRWSMIGKRPIFREGTYALSPDPASLIVEFGTKPDETIVRWGELLAERIANKAQWVQTMIYFDEASNLAGAPKEKFKLLIDATNKKLTERDPTLLD